MKSREYAVFRVVGARVLGSYNYLDNGVLAATTTTTRGDATPVNKGVRGVD